MKIITRTVYGAQLQACLLLGLPYQVVANTTLNERLGVQASVLPASGIMPAARYWCIGSGGHRNMVGANGKPYTSPINHRASDAAPFDLMPFVLRQVNDDISPTEREKYGLRKLMELDGVNYIAYYLKRLSMTDVKAIMEQTTVTEGVSTKVPFVPNSSNLNPTPPALPDTGVVTTSGNYLSTTATVPITFTKADVNELLNVARILYGDELYAVISEIGIVSGVDKVVEVSGAGNTKFNFKEVIAAQIISHITSYHSVGFTNEGFDFKVELGATEPLIGEADVATVKTI